MMTPETKSRLQVIFEHWKTGAVLALIAMACLSMGGCVTQPDGTKKFAPLETLKRADQSVENYYQSM